MVYVQAGVESMPLPTGSFDVVASINNFDHVEDSHRGISEIARVTSPGGRLLMMVEIHEKPKTCEPRAFPWTLAESFKSAGFDLILEKHFENGGRKCRICPEVGI
jgi:ubiquinone/menaquinone biosynthesis C-methylase UbiE